jgi:hypothetical protein
MLLVTRIIGLSLFIPSLVAQVNVLTSNYGNDRTNANLQETILTTSNVGPGTFGKIGAYAVDGNIYAQPLYVQGAIVGGIARNVLYVATMRNTVYAFDADAPVSAAPLWTVHLGRSVPSDFNHSDDTLPETGILSTPVIDLGRNAIYLVAQTLEKAAAGNPGTAFRLHALDLSDGRAKPESPVEIKAIVDGGGDDAIEGKVTFDPMMHLQRPGLLLANNNIYVAFGSHQDDWPYHGWIVAYDAAHVQQQVAVFNTTPFGNYGAIWQSGRGLAADAQGNIYAGSGNGDWDGMANFSNSFLKLNPSLKLLDWYTPANWEYLSNYDFDMASLGPILLPGTNLMMGGDKFGNLYLIDKDQLGHLDSAVTPSARIFQAADYSGIFNSAVWDSEWGMIVYLVDAGEATKAFRIADGQFQIRPFSQTGVNSDDGRQGMSISANGGKAGTGILWMTSGDHDAEAVPGTLHAFDALDLTKELWSSDLIAERDQPGAFTKFVSPTVVNGRVYLATSSNQIVVYGLLPAESNPAQFSTPDILRRRQSSLP